MPLKTLSISDRALALIRRATDPAASEEEARTSALIAVKELVKCGILLEGTVKEAPVSPDPTPADFWRDFDEALREEFRKAWDGDASARENLRDYNWRPHRPPGPPSAKVPPSDFGVGPNDPFERMRQAAAGAKKK